MPHRASIQGLFADIPVSSVGSSGQPREFRLPVAMRLFQAQYHHMDSVFGELCETLWFKGTMVCYKQRKNAGIHPVGSVSAGVGVFCSQVSLHGA